MDEQNVFDAADEASTEWQRANQDAEHELADIISEAARHLSDSQVGMLCWGCGIDKRLIQPQRRAA